MNLFGDKNFEKCKKMFDLYLIVLNWKQIGLSMTSSLSEDSSLGWLGVGRNTSDAVVLDLEVIGVHLHVEEAVVTPVGSPGVAADPVLFAVIGNTVADDGNLVVDHIPRLSLLGVDTVIDAEIVVELEGVSGVDTAAHRTVGSKLSLHLVSTSDVVVLADVVASVLNGDASFDTRLTLSGRRPCAVTADVDVSANIILIVIGLVICARSMDKSLVSCELIDLGGVTTIARSTSLAVNNHLG